MSWVLRTAEVLELAVGGRAARILGPEEKGVVLAEADVLDDFDGAENIVFGARVRLAGVCQREWEE